jgi:hypothetical protein
MDEARVRFPASAMFVLFGLTGAMVARLPTEQEVVGSSPTLGFWFLFRVRGEMVS